MKPPRLKPPRLRVPGLRVPGLRMPNLKAPNLKTVAAAPLAVVKPVHRQVRKAVETRRLGEISVDRGLDVLTFFLADVQTGFGPFIAVYLTANHWTAAQIGLALGVGRS